MDATELLKNNLQSVVFPGLHRIDRLLVTDLVSHSLSQDAGQDDDVQVRRPVLSEYIFIVNQ